MPDFSTTFALLTSVEMTRVDLENCKGGSRTAPTMITISTHSDNIIEYQDDHEKKAPTNDASGQHCDRSGLPHVIAPTFVFKYVICFAKHNLPNGQSLCSLFFY
ncbi:MAG: hypothetical protein RQ760_17675 [Sedimentisphaerales bacterium]|nr:hypothetical protein [Sedimentisphaerales bacterium]